LKEARVNIRAFHDAVLELGSVPLPVVTARIDRFIAEGGTGPTTLDADNVNVASIGLKPIGD
jgi:hypothetical protein